MDDDDEFDVSDNMMNDSIFLHRPVHKGSSINHNVYSLADDMSLKANAMVEPQVMDKLSQSSVTNPLHFTG